MKGVCCYVAMLCRNYMSTLTFAYQINIHEHPQRILTNFIYYFYLTYIFTHIYIYIYIIHIYIFLCKQMVHEKWIFLAFIKSEQICGFASQVLLGSKVQCGLGSSYCF